MFAIIENNISRILSERQIIGPQGQQASRQILELWSAGELAAWKIYDVVVDPIPKGHQLVSEELVLDNGGVRMARVTEVAPIIPPPNPVDVVGDYQLKIILSLQNEIRALQSKPALADVEALKVELKKTVTADVVAAEAVIKP